MRLRTEEVNLVVEADKRSEGWPGFEWLSCLAEPFGSVKDPLRITDLVLAQYPFRVQTGRSLMY